MVSKRHGEGRRRPVGPRGYQGPVPIGCWQKRLPILADNRDAFRCDVARRVWDAAADRRQGGSQDLGNKVREWILRDAIAEALIAFGLLSIRRRRNTLPIKLRISSNIM